MVKVITRNIFFIAVFLASLKKSFAQWEVVYSSENSFEAIDFITGNLGIVGGSEILVRTNDGGLNWQICNGLAEDISIQDISYLNSSTVYLSSFDVKPIWYSIDSGNVWINISDIIIGSPIYDLEVVDTFNSYAGGDGGFFYKTNDAFNIVLINNLGPGPITSISFCDKDTGYVAGGGIFLKTLDGGGNWIDLNDDTFINAAKLCFINPSIGWVSDNFNLYSTIDYGENWEIIPLPEIVHQIFHIDFVDPMNGFITCDDLSGNPLILKTNNGGISWVETDLPTSSKQVGKIKCLSSDTCFALSNNGVGSEFYILKTSNGGGIATGLNGEMLKESVSIYPNPAKDKIILSINNQFNINSSSSISICALSGKIISQLLIKFEETEIDVSEYADGIYFVKVIVDGNQFVQKLIID